jgi:hypothetical protein
VVKYRFLYLDRNVEGVKTHTTIKLICNWTLGIRNGSRFIATSPSSIHKKNSPNIGEFFLVFNTQLPFQVYFKKNVSSIYYRLFSLMLLLISFGKPQFWQHSPFAKLPSCAGTPPFLAAFLFPKPSFSPHIPSF